MATIVQPYNPWKEQLALTALGNVAGNIIGDIWKTHRQNEQNRKANAFRGQLQQDLQNNAQPDISLIPKEAPHGYNSNPWANAFHQNNSPLTAFDIGTSTVGKTPSIQDIMRTADNLAATPRFSMLGQDVVQGAKNSLIQNTIANMFSNAGDIQGQMNALTMGATTGSVAPQVLMAFSPYAQKMAFPYSFGESDLGQSKVITARNEHTGEITPGMVMPVSVSPDTAATVAGSQNVAKINAGSAENVARIHALGDEARAQATIQAQYLANLQKQYDALKEEIANDTANLAGLNEKDAIAMKQIIAGKEQKLAQLEQRILGAYSGTEGSQNSQGDLGDLSYWGDTSNGMGKDINGKPFDYSPIINKYAKQYGIDPDFAAAVMKWESGGNLSAISNKGAIGLFQLMPETAQQLGVNPHEVEDNIKGGIMYLRQMLDKYNGNAEMALRAYNAGPGATDAGKYPAETQKYVPGVLGIYRKFRSNRPHKQQATATQTSTPQQQPQTQTQNQTQNFQPYLRNSKTGEALSWDAFNNMLANLESNGYDHQKLFDELTTKGWELDYGQQNHQTVSALGGNTATVANKNTNNVAASAPANQAATTSQPTNRPFSLPGRPNYPKGYNITDTINWINSIKNDENPFSRHFQYSGSNDPINIPRGVPADHSRMIDGEFSDVPRFNALTPEDLHSPLSGNFGTFPMISALNSDFYTEQEAARRLLNGNFPFLPYGRDWSYLYR